MVIRRGNPMRRPWWTHECQVGFCLVDRDCLNAGARNYPEQGKQRGTNQRNRMLALDSQVHIFQSRFRSTAFLGLTTAVPSAAPAVARSENREWTSSRRPRG